MTAPTMIFSGMIAATPWQGGATWAVLQYLLGFRKLGWDVWFVEPVPQLDLATSDGAGYCNAVMERFGFQERWALIGPDGATVGADRATLRRAAGSASVLFNVSGMLKEQDLLEAVDRRVYLDLDPGFVQLWHEVDHIDMGMDAHTHFVTLADTIDGCGPIPTCGRSWIPTLPPVVVDEWPVTDRIDHDALTTVGHWRAYGSIHHQGVHYGQKAHSLRQLIELPSRVPERVLLALEIHGDELEDLAALSEHGWELIDPQTVASTPAAYRGFVAGSWAELGVAKSGYVASNSGWFSDRSACYLASGRPVIAQETGFSRRLPTGQGLFSFEGTADVVASLRELRADYALHRRAARAIVEQHLHSDRVLTALLDRVL